MYTTIGRKGSCGHQHENRSEAEQCLLKHQNEMRRLGTISDRIVVEADSLEELEDELEIY